MLLVCPATKQPVRMVDSVALGLDLRPATQMKRGAVIEARFVEPVQMVMLRDDRRAAYPVVRGVPIMLVPEMLSIGTPPPVIDLDDPKYAEAYDERDYYEATATEFINGLPTSQLYRLVKRVRDSQRAGSRFPNPQGIWLDATYDCIAQWRAYKYLAPLDGKVVLQLGGSGAAAVVFLLGGADSAWLLTPMPAEALMAKALAKAAGVEGRLECVVGVAEELPFDAASFDVVYSGGCIHHTVTGDALPEVSRILRDGGRFAAIDPWRAPLYALGTRLLGKREPQVSCRPLTRARVAPMAAAFAQSTVSLHGALTRYPLIALSKAGVRVSLTTAFRIMTFDELLSGRAKALRRFGSSVALLATK